MIIGERKNKDELGHFVRSIKSNLKEWQAITVKILDKNSGGNEGGTKISAVINKLLKLYENYEGIIFTTEAGKAVMIARLGVINNYSILKTDIENSMPEHNCRVIARNLNKKGIQQIQIDLVEHDKSASSLSLYEERERRSANTFLIADDDVFIRKTMQKILSKMGQVVEVENGEKVVSAYVNHNPDIVVLDIHMPGQNGLILVQKIMDIDPNAFIVVFSSDSVKENVVEALSSGAAGFLAKPVKREKLLEYARQCITLNA